MHKLNQVLAIEKGTKTRVYREFTDLHQATQKPDLMNGFYLPISTDQVRHLDLWLSPA